MRAELALALLVTIAVFAGLWALQRRLMYFPMAGVPDPAAVGLPDAERVSVLTEDGLALAAWFVPAAQPPSGATVLVFNGNGGHRAMRAPLAAALSERHIASLLLDYRGYGGNEGAPSEGGLALDARAARQYLLTRADVDPGRVAYFGESLGAAVAVGLASEHPPFALILRSPFTSMVDVARHHYPWLPVGWIVRDRYPSLSRIRRLRSPLLVIAAAHDTIVPTSQSRRVFEAADDPKELVIVEDADHNDYELLAGSRMLDTVARVLRVN